jgi:hypothetical protein
MTMVMIFEGDLDQMSTEFPNYSYRRNPAVQEFFIPAGTLIAVKL